VIKRRRWLRRKREHALCPIHTMRGVNPGGAMDLPLDGFCAKIWRCQASFPKNAANRTLPSQPLNLWRPWLHLSPRRKLRARAAICKAEPKNLNEIKNLNELRRLKLNQQEINQRDQGGTNAGGHQHVVGADIAAWIQRRLGGFLRHSEGLGPARPDLL
jgi:hypothetical protein